MEYFPNVLNLMISTQFLRCTWRWAPNQELAIQEELRSKKLRGVDAENHDIQ